MHNKIIPLLDNDITQFVKVEIDFTCHIGPFWFIISHYPICLFIVYMDEGAPCIFCIPYRGSYVDRPIDFFVDSKEHLYLRSRRAECNYDLLLNKVGPKKKSSDYYPWWTTTWIKPKIDINIMSFMPRRYKDRSLFVVTLIGDVLPAWLTTKIIQHMLEYEK